MMDSIQVAPIVNRNVRSGQAAHMPLAAIVLPSDVAWAIELRVIWLPQTSAVPYHDCRSPRRRTPATSTVAELAWTAAWIVALISSRRAVQYASYLDATTPVCSFPAPESLASERRGGAAPGCYRSALLGGRSVRTAALSSTKIWASGKPSVELLPGMSAATLPLLRVRCWSCSNC